MQCLHFRELMVFDTSYANVALGKSTTASPQYTLDSVQYTSAMAVNGIIDSESRWAWRGTGRLRPPPRAVSTTMPHAIPLARVRPQWTTSARRT